MTRPHVLLLCMDPGIQWESKKGASVHLRSMAAAFEEAGAKISVLTHDGVSTGVGGDRTFDRLGDIDAMHRYFHAFRSRSGYEMRAVASNSLYVEHARRLHMQQPVDIIYERFSLWSDVGARLAGELNAPLVVEVNAPLLWEQTTYRKLAFHDLVAAMEQDTFQTANRVVIVSRSLEEYVCSRGASSHRVLHLPNVAEHAHFAGPPFIAPEPGEQFRIGFAGSLKPWHGLDAFLDVFARVRARHPNACLEILGDGKGRTELETRVDRLGIRNAVTFLGHVAHADVPARLHRWHVIVAPYPAIPAFYFSPLKIAEGLAAGRPVMASDVGEIGDMMSGAGILVEPDHSDAWVEALSAVITRPETLTPIANAAAQLTKDWSWRAHAERVLDAVTAPSAMERHVAAR